MDARPAPDDPEDPRGLIRADTEMPVQDSVATPASDEAGPRAGSATSLLEHTEEVVACTALVIVVAAVAWGWVYKAQCVDTATLSAFAKDHYDQAPESSCSPGQTF